MAQRKIKQSDYDAIGFDVDNTLSKYNIPQLFENINENVSKYLVEKKNYPAEIMLQPFDKDFCTRGIIMDSGKGNFLKLAEDGTILRATHGTKFMSDDEIVEVYGNEKLWPSYREMIENVDNYGRNYRIFENLFDMPLLMVSARMIDVQDMKEVKPTTYDVFEDFMEAALHVYDQKNFANDVGGFFPKWKKNKNYFMQPMNPSVVAWLKKLKAAGKLLFIITSSFGDYAFATLEFLFGEKWQELFDVTLTNAKKPGFFNLKRPYLKFEAFEETTEVAELEHGGVYSRGNVQGLEEFFKKSCGKEKPNVLYFGDSTRSDVRPAKFHANWDIVYILEEMVAEAHSFVAEADIEPQHKKKKVAEPSDLEKEYLTSHVWGSFFTDPKLPLKPHEHSQQLFPMNTLWGHITRKYADIALPQLEYISDLNLDHELEVFDHKETFTWGFYPGLPRALQKDVDKLPDLSKQARSS